MESLGILSKEEVYEKKRPYFRYSLARPKITMEIDINGMAGGGKERAGAGRIREKKDSGAIFSTARSGDRISSVTVWTGTGRDRKERKINLTGAQGSFLFHLPFPNAGPMSVEEIMKKAGVDRSYEPEIVDLVELLTESGVLESFTSAE
jgi:hypothetical protein